MVDLARFAKRHDFRGSTCNTTGTVMFGMYDSSPFFRKSFRLPTYESFMNCPHRHPGACPILWSAEATPCGDPVRSSCYPGTPLWLPHSHPCERGLKLRVRDKGYRPRCFLRPRTELRETLCWSAHKFKSSCKRGLPMVIDSPSRILSRKAHL